MNNVVLSPALKCFMDVYNVFIKQFGVDIFAVLSGMGLFFYGKNAFSYELLY